MEVDDFLDGATKSDEALEAKALRRVIDAYINYKAAAEEDVRRWERSYGKLNSTHKDLLPHLPRKYAEIRRCISTNYYFISNMLQNFQSPFDMDTKEWDEQNLHNHQDDQHPENEVQVQGTECPAEANGCLHDEAPAQTRNKRLDVETNPQETKSATGISGLSEEACPAMEEPGCVEQATGIDWLQTSPGVHVPLADVDKVRCVLRNIVRDWTQQGAFERDRCYKPILDELLHCFPDVNDRRPSCLVPGAGLGRLACEISRLGFISQGNEFSYYMLICSSFILNCTQEALEFEINPWIHSNCNKILDKDQLQTLRFPDLHPGSAGITEGFSMCAGDFLEVYSHPSQEGAWDAVATCFFIDTAHNIVEYIEIISKVLRPGGVWINLGPLLYHFADSYNYGQEDEMSLELSLEDVKKVAVHYGFRLKKESSIDTTYTACPSSMMQNHYRTAFWTMVKKG